MAIQEVAVDLADYDSFIVEPFSDGMGGSGNRSFLAEVQQKVANRIIEKTYLTSEGKTVLRISGELIQYDEGSTTDKFVSPMQEAVCRVKLYDNSSGKVLGTANCTSRAKSSFRKGPEELAEGLGKAIADDWIVKHDSRGARPEEKD